MALTVDLHLCDCYAVTCIAGAVISQARRVKADEPCRDAVDPENTVILVINTGTRPR